MTNKIKKMTITALEDDLAWIDEDRGKISRGKWIALVVSDMRKRNKRAIAAWEKTKADQTPYNKSK